MRKTVVMIATIILDQFVTRFFTILKKRLFEKSSLRNINWVEYAISNEKRSFSVELLL